MRHATLGLTAVNFWNDGRASAGGITVDRKASVIVQNDGAGRLDVAVADPTQANAGTITVELDTAATGVVQTDAGVSIGQLAPTLRLTVDVPGAHGRSFRARFATAQSRSPARLTNLSTRAYLLSRDDAIIAGFAVAGPGTKRLLVRAIGPTLVAFGVAGALANPRLAIVDGAGRILGENDNWGSSVFAGEITAAAASVAAFPFAPAGRDAAALSWLSPGTYTAVATGGGPAPTGQALVEVYAVP